jgi:uncharacterized protein YkwD
MGAGLILLLAIGAAGTAIGHGSGRASAAADCTVDASLDSEEQVFLHLINDYRAQNGLQPLAVSYTLTKAAQWKSNDLAANNYLAHDDLSRTWVQRIRDCGYGYNTWLGENIAAGNSGAQATFDQWRNSAGHNANMLGANYTAIGIGRAYSATSTYRWYWTTDFGGVSDGWPASSPPATPTATRTPAPSATPTRTSTPSSATSTSTRTPTATTTAAALTLHVGDLDVMRAGSSAWSAAVTVTVHDGSHRPVAGAYAVGRWTNGVLRWCLTDATGRCTISSPSYDAGVHTATFTVAGVVRTGWVYVSAANHNPDGDSNGSWITVTH